MHGVPFVNPSDVSTLTVSSEGRFSAKQSDFDNPLVFVLSIGTFEKEFSLLMTQAYRLIWNQLLQHL